MTDVPSPIINTPRLLLRPKVNPPSLDVEPGIGYHYADGVMSVRIPRRPRQSADAKGPWITYIIEKLAESIPSVTGEQGEGNSTRGHVQTPTDSLIVGYVDLIPPRGPPEMFYEPNLGCYPQMNFFVHPAHRGHGYATEAVHAVIEAFKRYDYGESSDLNTMEAVIDAGNEPGQNVLRKYGFELEDTVEDDHYDPQLKVQVAAEYWNLDTKK